MSLPPSIHLVEHPLVQTKLTVLRNAQTGTEVFRSTLRELAILLAYEATRDLAVANVTLHTPLAECRGQKLANPVTLVPILRAGLGMAEAILSILPSARVGHVGMARNETTFLPESYYFKVPSDLAESDVLVVDPMLATGHSSSDAIDELRECGAKSIRFIAILGCQKGAAFFHERHPDVPVYLAAVDEALTDRAYITPGLGDAGDRYFGT